MKKLFSVLLALCLCLSAVSALAAGITWAEIVDKAAAIDPNGQFCAIGELGLMMWIPSTMKTVALNDADYEDGYIAALTTADEDATLLIFSMSIGEGTLEDYVAVAAEYGYTDIEACVVNGIPALTLTDAENDMALMLVATDAGYAIAFGFAPISNEAYQSIAAVMMGSLQLIAQ